MERVLITGGAGYVGSVLVPKFLNLGYKITVLDLMIYGEDVLESHPNLKVIKGDIRDLELLKDILSDIDIVIHLACISNDPSFELNPTLGKSINLDSFRPMLESCKKFRVKRFIYASSSSVYGIKKEKNVSEDMTLDPLTDYSKFKAECERILAEYQCDDFTTVTLRPATVCGYSPRQRLDVVVNILTNLAYHKREITVFGGYQLRPNIHIEDITIAYKLVLELPKGKVANKIYNVGDNNYTVLELANIVKSIVGDDVKLTTTPSNDNRSYHISSDKIKSELGFKLMHSIPEAVQDLLDAFKNSKLKDPLSNEFYFNIKRMKSINLQ